MKTPMRLLPAVLATYLNTYRLLVAAGFVLAAVMALIVPVQMSGASSWAYYYGVQNFARGELVIDDALIFREAGEARRQGGMLAQYVKIGRDRWALEKAPGYVFFLVPFYLLGIPRWGNIVLAGGVVFVIYLLLRRLRDEKTACAGALLALFTPMALYMLNRSFMDTFAAFSFLTMGGGLYLLYHLERDVRGRFSGGILLFLAFFLVAWSVVVRYTNFMAAAAMGAHFIITRLVSWRKGENVPVLREAPAVLLGVGLPAAVLLLYNYFVFGSALDYGYHYTRFPIKFAWQYLGQSGPEGQSLPWQIIRDNLKNAPYIMSLCFPVLAMGVPGFGALWYDKWRVTFGRGHKPDHGRGHFPEISWDVLILLLAWFAGIFFLYFTYEYTAGFKSGWNPFYGYGRFYLPGLFPVVMVSALAVGRLPWKIYAPVVVVMVAAGVTLYWSYVRVPAYRF